MANKISVSFKNTTKDMQLYSRLINEEEKSEFIKSILRRYFEQLDKKENKKCSH